ncbi:MAG: Ig-like domain-containing protein [Clostridia bacterium]|jgi:hypothetical protein
MFKKIATMICVLSIVFSQNILTPLSAKDATPPVIRSTTPFNKQTGIEVNSKLSVKFSENIYKGANFSKIKLTTKSNAKLSIQKSISKNTVYIKHTYFLKYNSTYYLYIPSKAIKDKSGNHLKKSVCIEFKTKAKPAPMISFHVSAINDASEIGNGTGRFYFYSVLSPGFYADGCTPMSYDISGTAVNGVDYELIAGFVNVVVGYDIGGSNPDYPKSYVDIVPKPNGIADGDKTVTITFRGESATITIKDGGTLVTP